jgi:hypothetical protein
MYVTRKPHQTRMQGLQARWVSEPQKQENSEGSLGTEQILQVVQ